MEVFVTLVEAIVCEWPRSHCHQLTRDSVQGRGQSRWRVSPKRCCSVKGTKSGSDHKRYDSEKNKTVDVCVCVLKQKALRYVLENYLVQKKY